MISGAAISSHGLVCSNGTLGGTVGDRAIGLAAVERLAVLVADRDQPSPDQPPRVGQNAPANMSGAESLGLV